MSICPFTHFMHDVSVKEALKAAKATDQPIDASAIYNPKSKAYKHLAAKHLLFFTGLALIVTTALPSHLVWLIYVLACLSYFAMMKEYKANNPAANMIKEENKSSNPNNSEDAENLIDEAFIRTTQTLSLR
jgi:predicted membrane protein